MGEAKRRALSKTYGFGEPAWALIGLRNDTQKFRKWKERMPQQGREVITAVILAALAIKENYCAGSC